MPVASFSTTILSHSAASWIRLSSSLSALFFTLLEYTSLYPRRESTFSRSDLHQPLANVPLSINYLAPEVSRIKPELLYWIFIPVDIICLILQAAGGAISVVSSGSSSTGVDIAMAGLGLQVGGLFFFSVLFVDYLIRYVQKKPESPLTTRMRIFFSFLGAAILLIFVRCVYRCYELSKGYVHSDLITDQGLFIGLEGV